MASGSWMPDQFSCRFALFGFDAMIRSFLFCLQLKETPAAENDQ
jgi:hypothetical protein